VEGTRDTSHPAFQLGEVLDLLAILIAGALLVLIYLGGSGILRILLALGFTFFVPGRAIVTNWPRMATWSEVVMPIIFSLTLLTLLATVTLWAGFWRPMDLFQAEAWLSLAGLYFGLVYRLKRGPVPPPPVIAPCSSETGK
jgi:hypothetical protein